MAVMTDTEKTAAAQTPTEPTTVPVEEAPAKPKGLKEYTRGEQVEVVKNGDWLEGHVESVEKDLNYVYVYTARGPVTVGNPANLRPRQS